jgi:hypothetical protein
MKCEHAASRGWISRTLTQIAILRQPGLKQESAQTPTDQVAYFAPSPRLHQPRLTTKAGTTASALSKKQCDQQLEQVQSYTKLAVVVSAVTCAVLVHPSACSSTRLAFCDGVYLSHERTEH